MCLCWSVYLVGMFILVLLVALECLHSFFFCVVFVENLVMVFVLSGNYV